MAALIGNALRKRETHMQGSMINLFVNENRDALMREVADRQHLDQLDESLPNDDDSRIINAKRKAEALEIKRHMMECRRQKAFKMRTSLKINDTVAFLLALFGVILAFCENENNYDNGGQSTTSGMEMRGLVLVSTVFLVITSIRHHDLSFRIARQFETYTQTVSSRFFSSYSFTLMLLEICVVGVCSPPGFDMNLTFDQLNGTLVLSLDCVLTSIMLLRVFLIPRLVWHYSRFSNEKSTIKCSETGCQASAKFVFKALVKERPFWVLSSGLFVSILVFALAVRVYERPYQINFGNAQDYNYVWNSMWLVVMTMTTVGYGEFYPSTHVGRAIIVFACFWGVFVVSLMVMTLSDESKLSPGEKRSFDVLSRLKAKEKSSRAAAVLVSMCIKYSLFKRKRRRTPDFEEERAHKYIEILHQLSVFQEFRKHWRDADYTDDEKLHQLSEQIELDLERLRHKVGEIGNVDTELKTVERHLAATAGAVRIARLHMEEMLVQFSMLEETEK